MSDPTRVGAQAALTSSRGRVRLIVGAVFCAVAIAMFAVSVTQR